MNLFSHRAALVAATMLLAIPTWAQEPAKPVDPPKPADAKPVEAKPAEVKPVEIPATPEELAEGKKRLDATIKAHGGDAFKGIKTLKLTGKGDLTAPPGSGADGQVFPVDSLIIYSTAPDKSRMDIGTPIVNVTIVNYGGDQGGYQDMAGNVTENKPGEGNAADPTQILRVAAEKNFAVRAIEEKDKDGKPLMLEGKAVKSYVITSDKGKKVTITSDAETGVVRRISQRGPTGSEAVYTLSEYKAFDGVQLPTKLVLRTQGVDLLKITFDAAEVNKPVDEKLYAKVAN